MLDDFLPARFSRCLLAVALLLTCPLDSTTAAARQTPTQPQETAAQPRENPVQSQAPSEISPRPNILFAIADDWGWPHAGSYDDPVVQTPSFDRLAREGMLCHQAFVSAPSCTPSRSAILAGMYHWQLGPSANLYGPFPDRIPSYPELLQENGYRIGKMRKCWGPGVPETKGRQLGGPNYPSFEAFLDAGDQQQPFCFWMGAYEPHRPYRPGSGQASGMALEDIKLPACFPDNKTVRSDVADYYFEVQQFDTLVGQAIELLEERNLLDNTIIAMTGDHGMPFPRCKGNLYDSGTRVPLAIRFPALIQPGTETETLISLTDLAPTFLELAGTDIPTQMTGRSLTDVFSGSPASGRERVTFGKERHCPNQEAPNPGGYPCRGLRTNEFLYVRNYFPNRWPAGTPNWEQAWMAGSWLGDSDNGPTKTVIAENRETQPRYFELCFGKRPAEELYDLGTDPDQLINVADQPKYQAALLKLRQVMDEELTRTGDPRMQDPAATIDQYQPYIGGSPKHPEFEARRKAEREKRKAAEEKKAQDKKDTADKTS